MPQSFRQIAFGDFERLRGVAPAARFGGKTLLITGATGFFGAWLLAFFSWLHDEHGQDVHVLAVSRDPDAFLGRHPGMRNAPWLRWIRGDIRDFALPTGRLDYIIHAATDTSAAAGASAGHLLESVYLGTKRVLECAARTHAPRILLVSSGAAYGVQPADLPLMREECLLAPSPVDPRNAYGEAKRLMEMLGAIHACEHVATVVVARCFAFVGAGLPLDTHFAIGNFIRDALQRDAIIVRGGGSAVRSYLYAADLVYWLQRLLTHAPGSHPYNVGSDHPVTIADLAACVAATLAPGKAVTIEGREGASPVGNRYVPSIARGRSEMGLDVWTDLPTAIARTALWEGPPPSRGSDGVGGLRVVAA